MHPSRRDVHDHRERDDALDTVLGEALVDQRARAFGRVPVAPGRLVQPVAELDLVRRSVLRGPEVEPAQEPAARLLDRGPEAVAGEASVVVEERRQDVALDLLARRRPAAGDEVHDVGIAVELDEDVHVVLGELPQHQALGLEKDLHPGIVLDRGASCCSDRPLLH